MNALKKIIPAFLLLFAGTASAYDHNLLWKAQQFEKSTWALSKHLNNNRNNPFPFLSRYLPLYNRHNTEPASQSSTK